MSVPSLPVHELNTAGLVFLLGSLGAIAPEIRRLYKARHKLRTLDFSLPYFAISFVYACLGGVVAMILILPNENLRAAFYAGFSLDVMLSAGAESRAWKQLPFLKAHDKSVPEKIGTFKAIKQFIQAHAGDLF